MKQKTPKTDPGSHAYAVLKFGVRRQDVRKAAILQAVIEILSEEGVDDLSFDRVGLKAKMSRSHVVYYFPNRDAMIEAAFRVVAFAAQEFIVANMQAAGDWQELLLRYIEGNFLWLKNHPAHASVFLLMYYQGSVKKGYSREIHSEAREHGAKRIAHILKSAPATWSSKALQQTAKGIQALITGSLVDAMSTDRRSELAARQKETQEFALALVHNAVGSAR